MKYAVIKIKGSQYTVRQDDELLIDMIKASELVSEVLLSVEEDKVIVGKPTVKGAEVELEIIGDEKGDKIKVSKYKAKSRYRKNIGFRPKYTRIKIKKITSK